MNDGSKNEEKKICLCYAGLHKLTLNFIAKAEEKIKKKNNSFKLEENSSRLSIKPKKLDKDKTFPKKKLIFHSHSNFHR